FFSHSPRTWSVRTIKDEEVERFRQLKRLYRLEHIFIHSSYLINLCSPDEEICRRSIEMMLFELRVADLLGVEYVVIHPGRAAGQSFSEAMKKIKGSLRIVSDRWKGRAGILLENTAGQKGDLSSTFMGIAEIATGFSDGFIKGICFDTAHAYQAGYDITTREGLAALQSEFRRYLPGYPIRLIHLNDSRAPFRSGLDRHEHIGRGSIGRDGFRVFLSYPFFKDIPLILETPKKTEDDDKRNLSVVKRLLGKID
ncbi:MAG: deoxyribonuclease IV, partial [Nitrospirae bacterium]|nr:deoxyribonuclease IV [Nitrospirota bacterium]